MQEYMELCIRRKYKARVRILELLKSKGSVTMKEAEGHQVPRKAVMELEEKGYVRLESETMYRNPVSESAEKYARKCLSEEQQEAVDRFCEEYEAGKLGTYLLHGVTGSGKTEVYLEAMEQVIASGGQVIVLIPEIALTYQTLMRFYTRFGSRVSVINSRMSPVPRCHSRGLYIKPYFCM